MSVDALDRTVFVATDHGLISMLNADTGDLMHTIRLSGSVQVLAMDERHHRLAVANFDTGVVSILDAATGNLLRTADSGSYPQAPALDNRTGSVFIIGQGTSKIGLLNLQTGSVSRVAVLGASPYGVLVRVHTGRVLLGNTGNDSVAVLDARTGALVQTRVGAASLAVRFPPLAVDERSGHLFQATGRQIHLLDLHSGRLLHTVSAFATVMALAIDAGAHACLALAGGSVDAPGRLSGPGAVLILDSASGAVRRTLPVGVGPRYLSLDERRRRPGRQRGPQPQQHVRPTDPLRAILAPAGTAAGHTASTDEPDADAC